MTIERFSAVVGANIKEFKRKMKEVDQQIRQAATGANANIGATIREFMRKMKQVKAQLKTVDGRNAAVNVVADTIRFYKTMALVQAKMLALDGRDVWINVKVKYNDFQRSMGRIATLMRNWGEIFSTQLSGALIMLIPTLSPIISSLIGLIGSLGVMLGVVGGSAFALVTAFGAAGAAAVAFTAVAIPTIKSLFDETVQLSAQQQVAKQAFNDFKATYDGLVKATETPVLQAFTTAMQTARTILQQLEPLFISSAEAVSRLMQSLQQNVNTKPIQDFFGFLNQNGAGLLETIAKSVGNLFKGLLSMMTAFGPLAIDTADGFLAMTQRFADWADGLKTSKSFQSFVDYVREHMPLIRQIFGDAFMGIIGFFTSFSDTASSFMTGLAEMMARFREWSATLGENQQFQTFLNYIQESAPKVISLIGNLSKFLINFGAAMAPIGSKILDLVNGFLQWTNGMMENHKWFSNLVGMIPVLIGGFNLLLPIVVGAHALFGSKLLTALKNVIPWFSKIGNVVSKVVPIVLNLAKKALPWLIRALGLVSGPVGWVITIITTLISVGVALYKNWDSVSKYIVKAWNWIKDKASEIFTNIGKIIANAWKWAQETHSKILNAIWGIVKSIFSKIVTAIVKKMLEIYNNISEKWSEAQAFLKSIDLVEIGKNIIQGLVNGIKSVPILGSVVEIGEKIVSGFKKFFQIHSPSKLMAKLSKWIPAGVAEGITSNLAILKSATNKMSKAIAPDFSKTEKLSKNTLDKIRELTVKASKKTNEEKIQALEEYISKQKEAYNLSANYEALYWQQASKMFKNGSTAKLNALNKYNEAHERALEEQLNAETAYIEDRKKFNKMSLAEELLTYEKYMAQYKKGTEQRKYYEEQVYETKKAIHEKLKSLSDDYLAKVQEINDKLISEEQALRDEYQQTYDSEVQRIKNFAGIFDKFTGTDMSEVNLLDNIKGQVEALRGWMQDLTELEFRGIDSGLLEELRSLGVGAANEIEALTKMSASDLDEFQSLWKEKTELANIQATKELANLKTKTDEQIKELHKNTELELNALQATFQKEIREIRYGTETELDYLNTSLPSIGRNAMQGFLDGIKSMESPLKTQVQKMADSIKSTMQQALDIQAMKTQAINASSMLAEWLKLDRSNLQPAFATTNFSTSAFDLTLPNDNDDLSLQPINLHVYQEWTGEDVVTYVDKQSADKYDIRVYKNGG